MNQAPDKAALLKRLQPNGQEHVLAFWDELDDDQRRQLAGQIEKLDLDLIDSLYRGDIDQPDWAELARRSEPPPALRLADRESGAAAAWGATSGEARVRGVEALRDGQVGVILVAGGQGSRLGFDKPKSAYPIGPLSGATLLQIHCEKIRAAARRYGRPVRMYLMTSPVTHEDTLAFVKANDRFGLLEDELVIFCQGTMPAVDAESGKLLMEAKDSLFLSPDGHGGTVAALDKSGALEHMRQHGVKQLFYFQVDNPLAPICDAEFIGHHLLAESELTSLAVAKTSPQDKLGNFVMIDGRLHVIEYSDFPADAAKRRDAQGGLAFWAGSVAIHVFDLAFLQRSLELKDSLPFHVAKKKAEFIDQRGQLMEPKEPNALKFERFIFDLLPHARRPIVVEHAEEESFAPLKNAPGEPKDTPEYVQRFMLAQHRRWLEAAGARLAEGVEVEISPLVALDAHGVAEIVEPGRRFEKSEYLRGEQTSKFSRDAQRSAPLRVAAKHCIEGQSYVAIEVEQKFRCDDLDAIRAALVRRGAEGGEIVEQVDRYYRHPVRDFAQTDEAFRMRTVGEWNFLTYKGPKLDAHTKTRCEEEVAIAEGPAAAATCDRILQRLSFTSVAEVRKRREVWRLLSGGLPVEAALDDVDPVGQFVELEIHVDATDKDKEVAAVNKAKAALADLAADLRLGNSERRSYLELLLERVD